MTDSPRPLRSDAAANRDRLLAAAVRSMLHRGRQVSLAAIADEAGVGVATLYRRFPDRDALLGALEARAYGLLVTVVDDVLAEDRTGIEAVEAFLVRSFALRDQLVLPLHGAPRESTAEAIAGRDAMRERTARLIARGHTDGTVRPDVTARTVVRFGAMLAEGLAATADWAAAAEEQRRVFLRGIAVQPA